MIAASMFVLLGTACGSGGRYSSSSTSTPPPGDATSVTSGAVKADESAPGTATQVMQKDFAITLDKAQASAGQVTFNVTNDGPSAHEFVVFKTDVAADALLVAANKVDEEATDVTHIDEIAAIGAGESKQLTVKLDPGKYVLLCNLAGHYGLGMRVGFEVS
ncbi:MAG: plastocyanin/azurin family copper-binding protein [Chloroflexota bacterium]|nr:plastocyanin/azurin family copper-binding protein [Chloroflexota bacterium]